MCSQDIDLVPLKYTQGVSDKDAFFGILPNLLNLSEIMPNSLTHIVIFITNIHCHDIEQENVRHYMKISD